LSHPVYGYHAAFLWEIIVLLTLTAATVSTEPSVTIGH